MGEIMICNQEPALLGEKLLSFSSEFVKEDLLRLADVLKRTWMIEALAILEPTREMGIDCRTGLILLMTILGGKALGQIPLFLADIDESIKTKVLNKYEEVLKSFYKSEKIVDWFKDNVNKLKPRNVIAAK